jgi:hypothetical protein
MAAGSRRGPGRPRRRPPRPAPARPDTRSVRVEAKKTAAKKGTTKKAASKAASKGIEWYGEWRSPGLGAWRARAPRAPPAGRHPARPLSLPCRCPGPLPGGLSDLLVGTPPNPLPPRAHPRAPFPCPPTHQAPTAPPSWAPSTAAPRPT